MRPAGVREATMPDDGPAVPEPAVTRWAAPADFDAFVRARHTALLRFAHTLTGDAELAQDLVQDALERTGLAWSRLRRRDDPEGYVRRIIVTRYVSWWRRLRRERLVAAVPEAAYDDRSAAVPDETLWRLLATLPPKQRAVLVLRFYEDLTEVEVARVLNCSVGAVKSNGSRALARLRRTLTAEGGR
jgi:RNA polymerase sigma-70 factor (sigma-E family)